MLDSDLAKLYDVETKQINRAVSRNKDRFPENFLFKLTDLKYESLRSQFVTLDEDSLVSITSKYADNFLRCQSGTSKFSQGGRRYLPYVFTEQGVSMLSGVLRSKTAIQVSVIP